MKAKESSNRLTTWNMHRFFVLFFCIITMFFLLCYNPPFHHFPMVSHLKIGFNLHLCTAWFLFHGSYNDPTLCHAREIKAYNLSRYNSLYMFNFFFMVQPLDFWKDPPWVLLHKESDERNDRTWFKILNLCEVT